MNNAVLYLRSSKDRSDVSIDAQRRQLQEYATTKNLHIIQEYSDAVESGKDEDRPAFQNMLRDMRNPKRGWNIILVLDTARISRRRHISIIFEEHECKRNGVKVFYKSLPDSDPITEMLLKSILQAMDEWHSLTSRAKGLSGMAENVKQGFRAGGIAPKGYKLEAFATGAIREGLAVTKTKLSTNDDSMLVRGYLQQRAKGLARARALAYIKQNWPVTTLLSMERNALTYAGHTVWNRHAEKADGGGYVGGEKYRPESEWVIQKNTHEPLISEEEAKAILLQIETRKVSRTKESKDVYLLAGILKSTEGATWHGSGDGSYRLGKGKRISAKNVDSAVIQCIKQDITSDVFATAVLGHYKALSKPPNKDKTLAKVISKIAELDTQVHKLAELLTKTTAQEALLRSIEKMEIERNELQNQLIEYREAESNQKTFRDLKLSEVKTMLNTVADELGNENQMLLKDALGSIIDTVILDEASMQATVTYKINNVTGDKMASPRGFEPRSPP
jgi:site-specific DNA recombinase